MADSRQTFRSAGAVLAGLITVIVTSTLTDAVLHATHIYPPMGERMSDALFVLATAYRFAFGVLGGYVTARLAPSRPVQHALALGVVGFGLSVAGAVYGWKHPELGPMWYPILLVVTAVPSCWLGGVLFRPGD